MENVSRPQMPELYGLKGPEAGFVDWSDVEKRLEDSANYWVCTTRPDGRPHAMPVWGFWLDGGFIFGTGRETTKARNLASNPAISVHLEDGSDAVILEGRIEEIERLDDALRSSLDAASKRKYNMALFTPEESILYLLRPSIALAWRHDDFPTSATRWRFDQSARS